MDREMRSAAFHFKDFLEGVVWDDLKNEMEEMRQSVRDSLESCSDPIEIYRFQGRAEVLRDLQLLPEQLYEALSEHVEEKGSSTKTEENDLNDLIKED